MKKSIIIFCLMSIVLLLPCQAFAGDIKVFVDGEQLAFDSPPVMENNRTLVPFRHIFEALGADVWFDAGAKTATGKKANLTISLPINERKGYVNGNEVQLDVASQIIKGRTLVPLRFIGENMGCSVEAVNSPEGLLINITNNKPERTLDELKIKSDDLEMVLELMVEKGENKVFTLTNPDRLVIDLEDASYQGIYVPTVDNDLVSAVRLGQFEGTTARVVVDLKSKDVLYKLDQKDDLLIITIRSKYYDGANDVSRSHSRDEWLSDNEPIPSQDEPSHDWEPDYNVIVLDAGHGGSDVGAIGVSGRYEKDLVLQITEQVKERLESKGFTVIMTRNGDQTRSLDERVQIANNTNAFSFVSIHANSAANSPSAIGVEVYTRRGSDHTFAKTMVNAIVAETGQNSRGDKEADFYVIKNTVMPAILIEMGFLSNIGEEQFLWDKGNQEDIVTGIVKGIMNYRERFSQT